MPPTKYFVHAVLLFFFLQSCAFTRIKRSKDIPYTPSSGLHPQKLNIYAPFKKKELKPVLVFFYGGNWTSGRKGWYSFLGSRWARKGVVTVIPDYPKSPLADYREMTMDAAEAVKWTKEHIQKYGGDPNRIFVAGHSAGAQLAALSSLDTTYCKTRETENLVKGIILIDPAGIDMYRYMKEVDYGPHNSYLQIFGKDEASWKAASAIFYLRHTCPPMLVYTGGRTYATIIIGAQRFVNKAKYYDADITYKVINGRRHIPMITQFFNTANPLYKDILSFIRLHK